MFATHPKTGSTIRIMRTETHLYRDAKTLVLLSDTLEASNRWSRYDTLAVGTDLLKTWKPTFIALTEPTEAVLEYIASGLCKSAKLCFFSEAVLKAYGYEKLLSENQNNIMCLEECNDMYPYAEIRYKEGESSKEDIAIQIARILRYRKLMGAGSGQRGELALVEAELPPELWLIQQLYTPPKAKRERELKTCLQKNYENTYVDRIVLLNETDMSKQIAHMSDKVVQEVIGCRLKYSDVLKYISESVPPSVICVFANSDIYLDETLRQLWSLNLEDKFLSLLRYEHSESGGEPEIFGPRSDSQDTWILTSDSVKSRKWSWPSLEFEFGKPGCDNVITIEMLKQKYVVCNPALSLRTHHVHSSGIRSYDPKDCLERPVYLYVDPTGLHDLEVKKDLGAYKSGEPLKHSSFTRRIRGDEKRLRTFCSMLKKKGYTYEADSENRYESVDETIHTFQKALQTLSGLVYGYNSIYVGSDASLKEAWANEKLNPMVPCIHTEESVAIQLDEKTIADPLLYIMSYFGKILSMRDRGVQGDFWMPRGNTRLEEFLRLFKWQDKRIPVVPYDSDGNLQIYSDKIHMVSKDTLVTKETVEALRSKLINVPKKGNKKAVLFQDSSLLTPKLLEALETRLEAEGWDVSVVFMADTSPGRLAERLGSASLCICCSTEEYPTELLYWMLPKGCQVIELQNEMKLRGEGAHIAGACGLDFWVSLLERGFVVDKVASQILEWSRSGVETLPLLTLTLPAIKEGYHSHSGDSFREMARLWGLRGYVAVKEDSNERFCRLGDTILYDRPTYEWYDEAGLSETNVLVGNPKPRDGHKSWSFWPRRPELVEKLVEEGVGSAGWSERSKRVVFYGRVENAIQKAGRSGNWSTLCDEFSMPSGANASYALTQEEYLRALSQSKYGLCLPGYGKKCHREVECMAMGCVPLVGPGVDMENYTQPPVEGVHYLRVSDVMDARRKLDEMSEEGWVEMSSACRKWWKENASCEGLWLLTRSLCCGEA